MVEQLFTRTGCRLQAVGYRGEPQRQKRRLQAQGKMEKGINCKNLDFMKQTVKDHVGGHPCYSKCSEAGE